MTLDPRTTEAYDDAPGAPESLQTVDHVRSMSLPQLKALHARWKAAGLVYLLRFPFSKDPVAVGADRTPEHLGLRDLWLLGDVREEDRAGALAFLQSGAVVEAIGNAPPAPPPPPPVKPRRFSRA